MEAKDTVMNDGKIFQEIELRTDDFPEEGLQLEPLQIAAEAQAEISFKAGYTQSVSDNDNWARETYGYKAAREELKKQVEGVKANAFSVSLFGDRDHQLKMDAMVSAYDVVLNKIKEMTK